MTLTECMKELVDRLRTEEIPYAVAGGFAAGLYRSQPRLTGDVDLILALGGESVERIERVLIGMGFNTGRVRRAELEGGPLFAIKRKTTPVVMVTGRDPDSATGIGADLLLNGLPWVETALTRALGHRVDFGFGRVPVLTLEDVLLSKLYALSSSANRPKDLDDLLSIYETDPEPDLIYLQARIDALSLSMSSQKKRSLPGELRGLF